MLLGIILLPLLARFSLICRMWAFPIIHVVGLWGERIGLSFWADAKGLGVSMGLPLLWAWRGGPMRLFFKPYQLPSSVCVRWACARAVSFLESDASSTCLLRAGLVRA